MKHLLTVTAITVTLAGIWQHDWHTILAGIAVALIWPLRRTDKTGRMSPLTPGSDAVATIYEGVVYDPTLDSGRKAVLTKEGEYVYIEGELHEGQRVRVTVEVLS